MKKINDKKYENKKNEKVIKARTIVSKILFQNFAFIFYFKILKMNYCFMKCE